MLRLFQPLIMLRAAQTNPSDDARLRLRAMCCGGDGTVSCNSFDSFLHIIASVNNLSDRQVLLVAFHFPCLVIYFKSLSHLFRATPGKLGTGYDGNTLGGDEEEFCGRHFAFRLGPGNWLSAGSLPSAGALSAGHGE